MKVQVQRSAVAATAIATVALLGYVLVGTFGPDADDSDSSSASAAAKASSAATEGDVATEVLTAQSVSGEESVVSDADEENPQGGSTSLQASPRFTGDAERDLREGARDVIVIPDPAGDVAPSVPPVDPTHEIGWDIKDVRLRYVAVSDELIIALNSHGVVGDPEGNGDPSSFDQRWIDANSPGDDVADLGAGEALTFALDIDSDGDYDLAIGTHYGNELSSFDVYEYVDAGSSALASARYGARVGTLRTAPSSPTLAAPDLIFSIADFSKMPGNDSSLDFGINVINGSEVDGIIGEDSLGDFDVPVPVRLDAEIGDVVWSDQNENGIQDPGEPGIVGVAVNLRNAADEIVASTTTGPNGDYLFTAAPGRYVVEFIAPDRAIFSPRFASPDEGVDSDANPATGRTPVVAVGNSDSDLTIDAGIIEFVPAPSIDVETLTEGVDADAPPGPELDVGSTTTFTYLVTNTGNVPLTNVVVSDDTGIQVSCPASELGVSGSMGCTASDLVAEGPQRNIGTASAAPAGSDEDNLARVSDSDPSHYVGLVPFVPAPSIDLETHTNGQDADIATGPVLIIGELVTFTYGVENTGNVDLVDVTISDDVLGDVCVLSILSPGKRAECELTSTVVEGPYANVGSVTGLAISPKDMELETVSDEDVSHHVGALPGPVCVTTTHGPRMHHGGTVVDETGYVAAGGSTIYIVTSEPGTSPDQPNEQVYVQVGDDLYGPTPIGLGALQIEVTNTGPVTILHHSVVTEDTSHPNSVEYDWCGTGLTIQTPHMCPDALQGPRLHKGGAVTWETDLIAAPGSTVSITTSEPGLSPGQPNEQVYVQVGEELFGPTPIEHGTMTVDVGPGGAVVVHHYSVVNVDSTDANSVEVALCGSGLTEAG